MNSNPAILTFFSYLVIFVIIPGYVVEALWGTVLGLWFNFMCSNTIYTMVSWLIVDYVLTLFMIIIVVSIFIDWYKKYILRRRIMRFLQEGNGLLPDNMLR